LSSRPPESSSPTLIAPPLLWSEVPSVLHEIAFRGEISNALAELALTLPVGQALDQRGASGRSRNGGLGGGRGIRLGEDYDAEYVALAKARGCRLVTLDGKLRRGADRLGFVVTPSELA
jgi:hypothetical protein